MGASPSLDNILRRWHGAGVSHAKLQELKDRLRSYGSCLVAYSGGVDSVFLARVAYEVLADRMLAVIADSPSLPRRELEEAVRLGRQFGFPVRVVKTHEFQNANYLSNPENRCYFCKHELFSELVPLAQAEGYSVLTYGENASDIGDHRPGSQAAAEFSVRAPLKEVGLTKAEIRALSAEMGLPTSDKPQMACLSSRIPSGERVTPHKLRMIEEAEGFLRDLGFCEVRVRHHDLPASAPAARKSRLKGATLFALQGLSEPPGTAHQPYQVQPGRHLARLEIGVNEMAKVVQDALHLRIDDALRAIGYAHVTLDLRGYRRGSGKEKDSPQGSKHAQPTPPTDSSGQQELTGE